MSRADTRFVVVGDCLLDIDLGGSAARLSPDAPVPVVDVTGSRSRAGGAGLVATMLARDGVDVTLVTALGDDDAGERVRASLDGVRLVAGRLDGPTPSKTRVHADGHAIARLDEGCGPASPIRIDDAQLAAIAAADVLIASDYARGLLVEPAIRRALAARGGAAPIVWDPHSHGVEPVPGVALATPNRAEASALAGIAVDGVAAASDAGRVLLERWRAHAVAVTLGERGAVLTTSAAMPAVLPAERVHAADPCGAGDRLAASAAMALAAGSSMPDAVAAGVAAAGTFLRRGGVATLSEEAERHPQPRSLPGTERDAIGVARRVRAEGGTVVATGGCFDLLHAGHVRTLQAARSLGDFLIVCLNSDDSVRRLKGPGRPIISEADRIDLLLALECVDGVLPFAEATPTEALRRLAPDLWVKGGDYGERELPEAAALAETGGRAVTVPYHPARSTSALAAALAAVG